MGSVSFDGRGGGNRFRRALSVTLATLLGSAAFATVGVSTAAADTGSVSIDNSPAARVAITASGVGLTWTITAPDGSSCALTNTASTTVEANQTCGDGDVTLTATAEGPHTLTVTSATDSSDVQVSAPVDVIPPAPVVMAAPASPDTDPTPTWTFDPIVSDASVTCTLTHGPTTVQTQTACASPFTADDLTAGATGGDPGNYTLTLTQTAAGETSDPSVDSTYDFEPPGLAAPTVTADNAHGVGRHPTFAVTGLATGATVDCSVDPPAGGPAVTVSDCDNAGDDVYQLDLSGGDAGRYTLQVTQTVGGVTSAPGSDTYVLDVTPPVVEAVQSAGAGAHPQFTISGLDPGTTPVCVVNGPSVDHQSVPCDVSTSLDLSGDDPGRYALIVRAQDGSGNVSDPVSATYEYEPSGPPAPTVTAPSAAGNDLTPTFAVSDAEDVSLSFQCSIVGTDPQHTVNVPDADCGTSTTVDLTGLPDDVYTLSVTATDAVGNVSDPGTATYTLDTSTPAPSVTLATPASSPSSQTQPSYTFDDTESVDGPDTFSCVWTAPSGDQLSSGTCASGDQFDTAGKGDGNYTLKVTASDSLGNHAATTVTYVLEADVPPAPTVAVIGATTGQARAVSFSVSDSESVDDLTYACTLSGGDLTDQPVTPCGSTTDVVLGPSELDGPYTLSVTATDGLGHTSDPGTATYTLDTVAQAPTIALVTPASSPSNVTSPVFSIIDNELAGGPDTFSCTWTGPSQPFAVPAPCPAGDQFSALLDGQYTLSVTATDVDGNVSPAARASYDLDTTAPATPTVTRVNPSTSPSIEVTPTFSVSNPGDASPGGLTYSCVVTNLATSAVVPDGDVSCGPTTTVDLTSSGDGRYQLSVTATDAAGNVSAAAGTLNYRLDTVAQAPTVTLSSPVSSPGQSSSPTFQIADNEQFDGPDSFACTWSGPDIVAPQPAACLSGDGFPALVDGDYTLSVVATDLLGNVSSAGVASYERDASAQAPTVVLESPVSSPSSVVSPTFSILDNELADGPDTFLCTWSGPGIASPSAVACADGDGFAVVDDGDYTLSVTATDLLGNVSDPASAIYHYDGSAQAPTVVLATPASSPSNVTSPSFTITDQEVADGPDTFACTWSGPGVVASGAVPCGSGASFATVDDGDYTLSVIATDTLGNLSAAATLSYTYDGTAPDAPTVTLATPASSPNTVTTPTFSVSNPGDASPGGLTYTCVMTNTTAGVVVAPSDVSCGATTSADLTATGDGSYTLSVTATDAAGNTSTTPGTASYTLDTAVPDAPTVVLTDPASSPGNVTSPTFSVSNPGDSSPGGLTYRCVVTNASTGVVVADASVSCGATTTADLTATGDGDYTLAVTATDAAGNASTTAGTASYTLDTAVPDAPTVVLTDPSSSPGHLATPSFSVSNPGDVSPGGLTYRCVVTNTSAGEVVVDSAVSCGAMTTADLTATGDGDYTIAVTATDAAGNSSATAGTASYSLDTVAPAQPLVALATPASSPNDVTSPTFSVSNPGDVSPGGLSYRCVVTNASTGDVVADASVSCGTTTSVDLTATGDGDYTLAVTATDAAGNASTTAGTATYTLDTAVPDAPTVVLTDPASSPGNVTSPTFSVSNPGDSSPGGLTYRCVVTNTTTGVVVADASVSCGATTSADLTATGDGSYTLSVTATDAAGNTSTTPGTASYTLDTAVPDAPTVVLTDPASSPGNATSPTFSVSNPGDASPGGLTYSCVMTNTTSGMVVTPSDVSCGATTTADLTSTGDGDYTLAVTATDAAGNSSTTAGTASYTLDTTVPAAPTVVLTDPTSSPGHLTTATFTVSEPNDNSPGAITYSCVVTKTSASPALTLPAADVSCGDTTTVDLATTGDGDYTLAVTATDAAGNVSTAPGTSSYTLDTAAPSQPVVVLTNPASSPGRVTSPTFAVSNVGDDLPGTMTYSCLVTNTTTAAVVADASVTCGPTTTADLTATGDGDYTIAVTATDAAGNSSATAGTATYTLDATAPDAPAVLLASPASSPNQDKNPTFSVSNPGDASPGGVTYTCTVTNTTTGDVVADSAVSCGTTTSVDLTANGDGTYAVAVTATDRAGNVSAPGTATYALDTTSPGAPTVTLTNPSSSPGNVKTPTFAVTSPGDQSPGAMTYVCSMSKTAPPTTVVDPSHISCGATTTVDLTTTGDGTYILTVSATDAAGNVGTATGSAMYVLDTVAPPPPVVTVPKPATKFPAFGITDGDPTAMLHCTLIAPTGDTVPTGTGSVCPPDGTFDTSAFPDGVYTLTVTAIDPAGNATSTTVTWTRDTTPPPPPVVVAPKSPSNDRSPVFSITDTEMGVTFNCVLTGPGTSGGTAFTGPCPANGQLTISGADGTYVLTVTATDAAGNVQLTTGSASYILDTTPPAVPTVVRTSPVDSPAQDTAAEFSVTDADSSPGGITFSCTVTGPTPVPPDAIQCADVSRIDLQGPDRDGSYTFAVLATDAAGNVSSSPGTAEYTLDTTPPPAPTIALLHPTSSPGNVVTPTFALTDADTSDGMTFTCSVTGVTPVLDTAVNCGPTTTVDLSGEGRDGSYALSVTATDFAGNTSTTAGTFDYLLDTQPPAPPLVQLATATRSNETRPLWTWQYGPDDTGSGVAPALTTLPDDADASGLTATCHVSGPAGWTSTTVGCAHHFRTLLAGGDGAYKFTVTLADAAGNTASTEAATYHLDSTAPAGAVVFLKRPVSTVGLDRHPIWTITGPATSTFRCTLLQGGTSGRPVTPEATCTNPASYSLVGMPDGTYTLKVVAVDAVGNRAFPAYASYILEPVAPKVRPPHGTGSLAVWTVIGNPNDRLECTLARSGAVVVPAATCDEHPTYDMSGRPAGVYTLSAVQIGAGGTRSAAGSASWFWSGQVTNTGGSGDSPSHHAGGPSGDKKPTNGDPLAGLSGLVRHQIRNVVHGSGRTVGSHFPALPHPIGPGSGVVSAVQSAVHTIGSAGGGTGFPLLLVGLVLAFLIAQNRIDRRDPKLALASIAADDLVEFQLPPSREDRP